MTAMSGRAGDTTLKRRRLTAFLLVGLVGGMVGLAFASVPLYRLFCQVTGYGGTPRVEAGAEVGAPVGVEAFITVRFDANVNSALPWAFEPEQRQVRVRLGESALAHYRARNLSASPVVGTATFNVTPFKAAQYFAKIDCFCFTEQRLEPGQEIPMPVSFYVDPAILDDPDAREVRTITLSYTFFRAEGGAADDIARAGTEPPGGG
jgi:cytochrome c oxidase assembly protein subunit 11